jgi:predicted nucleotidyltransferase
MFGLTPAECRFIQERVVAPLEAQGAAVFCFGSRARGDNMAFSDLDLMVESDADLSATIGQLQEQLSSSNFPYKVDLVQFRQFAEEYRAGYLRDRRRIASARKPAA